MLGRYISEGLGDDCELYSERSDTAVVACLERHSCCKIGVSEGEKRSKMYSASTALMANSNSSETFRVELTLFLWCFSGGKCGVTSSTANHMRSLEFLAIFLLR